jgi:ATP:ADP antiporter, AAA family
LSEGLTRRLGIEPDEQRLLVLMGALISTLLGAYTLAKVHRDAMFLAEFGALGLPYAYIAVAIASAGFVWLEGRIVSRFTRVGAARWNQYAAIASSLVLTFAFALEPHWTAAAFYIWTGSQAMMLLPHYWVLALDIWDPRRARQIFPVLSGFGLVGGVLAGAFAGFMTRLAQQIGIMWVLTALLIAAHFLTRSVEKHRVRRSPATATATARSRWDILRRSHYLQILAVGLALSVVVATMVDFQFKLFIQGVYPSAHALTRFLGIFYLVLNGLALIFQFGAAGWLLTRLGVTATGVQPALVMIFSWWVALSTGWWAVLAMRWVQGVVLQGIGKSSSEIYYMAVRPQERRRIKPAIDTLVERWSDAVVGVLLIVLIRMTGITLGQLAFVTAVIAGTWLVVLTVLNRQYGRAFEKALSSRWLEPEDAAESLRVPGARRALIAGIRSQDERRVLLAVDLAQATRDREIGRAVQEKLEHPSPAVRAAAVRAMEAMRLKDPEGRIERFRSDPHEGLARAAVHYMIAMSQEPNQLARTFLENSDARLSQLALEVLLDRPHLAPRAVTAAWVDARLHSGTREGLLRAAQALGVLRGPERTMRLRLLLQNEDLEVRRAALSSVAHRPDRGLLDLLLHLLEEPATSFEAAPAIAALGGFAIPELERLLEGEATPRVRALAVRTLAQIGTSRAVKSLLRLASSEDPTIRHLGLQALSRVRLSTGRPVLSQSRAHKIYFRELKEYRMWSVPGAGMAYHPAPEVRLLGESCREFAEMALERAFRALACWYEPKPISGAYERMKSRDQATIGAAFEYLGHILPRQVFLPAARILEAPAVEDGSKDGSKAPPAEDRLAGWITLSWRSGDAWLRACSVRASRWVPHFDPAGFRADGDSNPIVEVELHALQEGERPSGLLLPLEGSPPPARGSPS